MKHIQKQNQKREEIARVFIDMLNTTPLENLRTQELCERAKISKSTFYRLFADKYALAFWIYQNQMDIIVLNSQDLSHWDEWVQYNYDEMRKHKTFYHNIASYRGQNSFYDSLALYYRRNILKFRKNPHKILTKDQEYAVYMFSIVNAQVVVDWILSGFEDSAENLVHRTALCLPECIQELFE